MEKSTGKADFLKKFRIDSDLDKWRFFTSIAFFLIVVALAWQSDDAYHGYVMSRNLAEGHGLVYNIGERATASTCPLFTLIIAFFYFFTREMFFTSLLVCTLFSMAAYQILVYGICRTKEQVIISFITLSGSQAFISYTTSGLENSLLFFLSAMFLYILKGREEFNGKEMFELAVLISLLAMARMDSVLIFVPVIVWIYLFKRKDVSFIKAVGIGIAGLLPFILWELFAGFYFGFPFPNPAYVKLGTAIDTSEYIKRGILYTLYTALVDAVVVVIPAVTVLIGLYSRKLKYILVSAGVMLYGIYVIRIGGDFMMGRHFTNMFFVSVCLAVMMMNDSRMDTKKLPAIRNVFYITAFVSVIFAATFGRTDGSQYLAGHKYSSQISDEREYYFNTTSLYNNVVSLIKTGHLCVQDTWNNEATDDLRQWNFSGGIIENAAGILVYYNPDLYLNDTFALGDPFLSKLPAEYKENWRVGHLRREIPEGYQESVRLNENLIEDEDLHQYYDKIRLLTRADLFAEGRLKTIIDMNLGKYRYLIDNYEKRRADAKTQEKTAE
ncbi:MAG: hypothetical protein K5668_02350 [Lachnospiraceae bacterium]|nr:hypothetical protein [Lachnospiraceae bacterium]